MPWGGTSLPVYFENDARVRSCSSFVGFYDNNVMQTVHALGQKWEAEYKDLPKEQQDGVIKGIVDSTTPSMPPRERTTLQRSVDFAIGRGQLAAVRATVHGVTPYISTGALQVAAVVKLLDGETARVGFASGSKAFGHRYLLGFLEQRGLARATVTPALSAGAMAIIDFFDRGWRINPVGHGLHPGRAPLQLRARSARCPAASPMRLLAAGFPKETKGAVWAANDVTAWACTLGLWRANMCWIPVGARNAAEENHYLLEAFDCEVLFFQAEFAPVIAELRARLPRIRQWICIDAEPEDFPGALSLQRWVADQPDTRPEVPVDMDDVVMLSATGGTTGAAEGRDEHASQHADLLRALHDRLPLRRRRQARSISPRRR